MKKLFIAGVVIAGLFTANSAFAANSELEVQYETLRYTSGKIVDANRSILKALPSERELAKMYSSAQLAKMITQLKNVMSADTGHVELLIEVVDTLYNELKK